MSEIAWFEMINQLTNIYMQVGTLVCVLMIILGVVCIPLNNGMLPAKSVKYACIIWVLVLLFTVVSHVVYVYSTVKLQTLKQTNEQHIEHGQEDN